MNGQIVLEAGDYMGETPVWSEAEQALYWGRTASFTPSRPA